MEKSIDLIPKVPHSVFVHLAGFTREKNHQLLIGTFTQYRNRDPNAQLWLIGDGPLREEIEKWVQELGFDSIRFFGAMQDPWRIIPENAILLLTSRIEGMPSVLAEACWAGIPSISFSVGGITEMMGEIAYCKLTPPDDGKSFLEAMEYWSTLNEGEKSMIRENSRKLARDRFSIHMVSRSFLEFYSRI
jgi:glycosyltransferase involved in cell wall biosynthesis